MATTPATVVVKSKKVRRPAMSTLIKALEKLEPTIKVSEISKLSDERAAEVVARFKNVTTEKKKEACLLTFFKEELNTQLKGGAMFIEMLYTCKTEKTNYARLRPVYRDLVGRGELPDWARRRELLLATSAIWRYTFNGHSASHKFTIDAMMECTDCCAYVQKMVARLKKEGLW
jgi:hypothetical protein